MLLRFIRSLGNTLKFGEECYQPICDKVVSSSHEVKLVKIPGHSAILGNDTADQKAKETAS